MDELIKFCQNNQKGKPIFSAVDIIDWYDGIVLGIGKLADSELLFLCNLVAWDMNNEERIYALLPIDEKFRIKYFRTRTSNNLSEKQYKNLKQEVANLFSEPLDSYLIKTKDLEDASYELKKIPIKELRYFQDIEDVVNQNKLEQNFWFSYFNE